MVYTTSYCYQNIQYLAPFLLFYYYFDFYEHCYCYQIILKFPSISEQFCKIIPALLN